MSDPPAVAAPPNRRIFLIGFMASGKTTVGRALARELGLPFVDLDAAVEADAGRSIADIFAGSGAGDGEPGEPGDREAGEPTGGEPAFRRLEALALSRAADGPPAVIATGGGAPCHGDNLALMRARGLVVALDAPLPALLARARADAAARPLLAAGAAEAQALYERRQPAYRRAHVEVRTEGVSPEAVAARIAGLARAADVLPDAALPGAALVDAGERPYPVLVAPGALDQAGDLLRRALGGPARAAVVTDDVVAPLYGARTVAALAAAGFEPSLHRVPAGEQAKSFAGLERLVDALIDAGLDRGSAVVALGGGVVGDLAGFAASGLFRGVACAQVPTTILAMIDSAIGGKTGIDTRAGKNLFGAFWQPRLVLCDPDLAGTLPPREQRAAFGELVKYALLDGEPLYARIDELAAFAGAGRLTAPEHRAGLTDAIARCAAIKCRIVSRDEREQTGERAALNLGHTIGHAIEAAAGYALLHGEAVALGLLAACRVSAHMGLCDPDLERRVAGTLGQAGLDVDLDPWLRPEVLARVGVDKKRTGRGVRFIAVRGVGDCAPVEVALESLSRCLRGPTSPGAAVRT